MTASRFLIAIVLLLASILSPAHAEIRPEFLLFSDPGAIFPDPIKKFSPRLGPLWLEALESPQADLQRMAADAIARGHRGGVPGLESSVPTLAKVLMAEGSHAAARLAAARALVELEARPIAPQMAQAAERFGSDLRQLLEPALAEWKYEPMYAVWRDRLGNPQTRHRDLMLAIRCLGTVGDAPSLPALLAFVHDPLRKPDIRAESARAAGLIGIEGLESDARRLLEGEATIMNRLCAVQLLAHHAGDEAQGLLNQLAVDAEPAVAVIALDRLIEIDPHLVLPLAERSMQNADAKVRFAGARAYVLVPDPSRVVVLSRLLDDPHPDVRGYVRESMYQLADQAELEDTVRRSATEMLAGESWRGLEQAALVLTALDHKPAAPRFIELLEFPRAEVAITVAWGLKTLALPETLPAMFDKAKRNTEARLKGTEVPGLDEQTGHLNEAFGKMKYALAEPLLRQYIPKNLIMGHYSRGAAIWSLGLLHAGTLDEELAVQLYTRATDNGLPPEDALVREMSAITIGRMRAREQAEALRKYVGPKFHAGPISAAVRWALIECNSPPIPELVPLGKGMSGWFLEPIEKD
jgi:HEAT repeat protein